MSSHRIPISGIQSFHESDVSSSENSQGLTNTILNWLGTFKQELGEDSEVESFEELYDGVILIRIVLAVFV